MADFEEALNSLLADPDAMGQIMSLAGKLGMGTESPPSPGEAAPQPESAAPAGRLFKTALFRRKNPFFTGKPKE